MRLEFTTGDFVYGGRPRPGFPLILDDDMRPAEPFHAYLRHRLLERGKKLDTKSWEAYGRRLWDFANLLHANQLVWNQPFGSYGASVVRMYRDWQAEDLKLQPSTINDRLEIVADMYRWAVRGKLIDRLPFEQEDITVRGIEDDLAHVTGGEKTVTRPVILLDEWEQEPMFLTAEQIKLSRASIRSTSQRILFDLMVRVGLRSIEARTFPRCYVFDPRVRRDIPPASLINVWLRPADMDIKFDKKRLVHVPYSLMEDMHTYTSFERNRLVKINSNPRSLLLTVCGNSYSKESAVKVMKDLGGRLGFRIRPLMLRHSFAIHTLLLMRSHPELKLEPLMYLRDRLGHANVQTTMVYLQQIERLLGGEALAMMSEFDRLFDVTAALQQIRQSSPAE